MSVITGFLASPVSHSATSVTHVLHPSRRATVVRGAYEGVSAGVDVIFGTHWAYQQHRHATQRLRAIRDDRAMIRRDFQSPVSTPVSPVTQRERTKNIQALQHSHRHEVPGRVARRHLYGEAVGVGGLAYGTGAAMSSTLFGSVSTGLLAASPVLLWVGSAWLSPAAVGMAIYEGCRVGHTYRVQPHLGLLTKKTILGFEAQVQQLLDNRLQCIRRQASLKSAGLMGLAASAPLSIAGVAPGLIVAIPSALAVAAAVHIKETKLRYVPQFTAQERLALGSRRDIMNRIHFTHLEYASLKGLKERKRLLYPHGSFGIPLMRVVANMKGRWQRRHDGHLDYVRPQLIVDSFLTQQSSHEMCFLKNQLTINAYEQDKDARVTSNIARANELTGRQTDLAALYGERQRENAVLLECAPGERPIEVSAAHFICFLQRYNLFQPFLQTLLHDSDAKPLFVQHGLIVNSGPPGAFTRQLDVSRFCNALSANVSPLAAADRTLLAMATCRVGERFLLTREKQRVQYRERDLLNTLAYRIMDSGARNKKMQVFSTPPPRPAPSQARPAV